MIVIDGSQGEGGGQILRTALALSLVTGKPFRIEKIRARRDKPGLRQQHLTAVRAAAQVGAASVNGAELGSTALSFTPGRPAAGNYRIDVGTAGSTTLVLQTILPPLMMAEGPSRLTLIGGTHNIFAPPFDFLARAFLPLLGRIGWRVAATLERPGFYPAGGGQIRVAVEPAGPLEKLDLMERGALVSRRARAAVARLPRSIADRELKIVREKLQWPPESLAAEELQDSAGPGNVLTLEAEFERVTEVFTGFGQRGVPAERVAETAIHEAHEYLGNTAPVGRHLSDQLLIPLALAGGGRFRTLHPTSHTTTNADVIRMFLDIAVEMREHSRNDWEIEIRRQ